MSRPASFPLESIEDCLGDWLEGQSPAMARQADSLPLRRDMGTFLTFVRDHKVVGTGARNMPLAAVREVTARFVDPPRLEAVVGDTIDRIRSEEDVWALYFLHVLADVGGLITAGRARRWRLTKRGSQFLDKPPLLQVAMLAAAWWYRTNWLIAYPYTGMGNALPYGFSRMTLAALQSLPTGIYVPVDQFADDLIEETGLTWGAPDSSFATTALRGSIGRMVIHILAGFGALRCRYRRDRRSKLSIRRLSAFKVTPWGTALLHALEMVGSLSHV